MSLELVLLLNSKKWCIRRVQYVQYCIRHLTLVALFGRIVAHADRISPISALLSPTARAAYLSAFTSCCFSAQLLHYVECSLFQLQSTVVESKTSTAQSVTTFRLVNSSLLLLPDKCLIDQLQNNMRIDISGIKTMNRHFRIWGAFCTLVRVYSIVHFV